MSDSQDIELIAHLMRRAGFGCNQDQLDRYVEKGYDALVEELLNPELQEPFPEDLLYRYYPYFKIATALPSQQSHWILRMTSTNRPLEEKMALFWHNIFATGFAKVENAPEMQRQIDMFRNFGLGKFSGLLIELSKDPAMIFWLDNCENHKDAINENYGRELLELFSMGVGMDGQPNYSERDVQECARAFTGWTIAPGLPRYPYGEYMRDFQYLSEDHDEDEKIFLGQKGNLNGEDIVNIICQQPATARFIARHMYSFFVADEPPVLAWQNIPPQDPETIELLEEEYFRSNYDIRAMLRVLLHSKGFQETRFSKVKSPVDLVVGIMRLVDNYTQPQPYIHMISSACNFMGQELLNPPTVEGWHTGKEWIDSGAMVERINFAADQVGDIENPGVQRIVERLRLSDTSYTARTLVEACLDLTGHVPVSRKRKEELINTFQKGGPIAFGSTETEIDFAKRVTKLLQLIVSAPEYQLI